MTQSNEVKIDKSTWGDGPWQSEPDRAEWRDSATGLPCLAVRHESCGHWCGYVGVSPDHPLHRRDYDDAYVSVHGGLTYAAECRGQVWHVPAPGESEDVWWFGFDCAHCDDLSPGIEARLESLGYFGRTTTYRTLEYVRAECADLAKQLRELEDVA